MFSGPSLLEGLADEKALPLDGARLAFKASRRKPALLNLLPAIA